MSYFYCRNLKRTCHILGSFSMYQTESLNLARSRGFIFPEAFRLTLVKGIVRIKNVELRPLVKARERKEKSFLIEKDVLPASQQSNIVYEFSCHCDSRYVGRTSQRLQDRIKQHVPKSVRTGQVSQDRKAFNR